MKQQLIVLILILSAARTLLGDTSWTNGGSNSSWADSSNWSDGVPPINSNSSNVTIGSQPTSNLIGIDTGIQNTDVNSLTLSGALTGSINFLAAGVEQLTIHSNLSNTSNYAVKFSLPVLNDSLNECTYATGGGLEFAGGINIGSGHVNVTGTGAFKLGNGSYSTINVYSSSHGDFGGSGTVNFNGTNLQFAVLSSTMNADTFFSMFPSTSGTLASVSLVGNYYSGSLTESPSGFWSGYVGANWWSFDQFSGVLSAATAPLLSITSASTLIATTGTAYFQSLAAVNGTAPYAWTVLSGSLPSGLNLSNAGLLSGTPSSTGTFSFTVKVTDGASGLAAKNFKLVIVDPLVITTSSPGAIGTAAVAYSQLLGASGGTPSYSWSVASGALPSGLSLNSAGLLSGTPTVSGSFLFVVKVTDSSNTITTQTFSLIIRPPLTISTSSPLPGGTTGTVFSSPLVATGGASPYAWSVSGGTLPNGLSLDSTGLLSGTPTATGVFNFTAQVTDSTSVAISKGFAITVVDPLVITSSAPLSTGTTGHAYSVSLTGTGGTPAYTWSLTSGSLPGGLTLNSAGLLSGTPSTTGSFSFIVKLTDSLSITTTKTLSFSILAPLTITSTSPIFSGSVSYGYSQSLHASGGVPPYSWSVAAGALPGGLSLSAAGVVSGIPTGSGTFQFTAKVTDDSLVNCTKDFTIAILTPLVPNGALGTFMGLIDRQRSVNGNLGGRIDISTTSKGGFSGKLTQAGHAVAFKGTLNASGTGSQVNAIIASGTQPSLTLALSFDGTANTFNGTLATGGTNAPVNGWRRIWDKKTNPAVSSAGFYTFGLDLDAGDVGNVAVPQGTGYGQFTVGLDGGLRVTGKTADGNSISTSGFAGANGEIAVYQSLYSNQGSLLGKLALTTGSSAADTIVSGTLSWFKPADSGRSYAAGFGPISVPAYGKYLAAASSGGIVLGLPDSTGTGQLLFNNGGLSASVTNPDVNAFTFTNANMVVMPLAGSVQNPASATLKINPSNGSISGQFTLIDGSLTRKVKYQGLIIRPSSGATKAFGYFLLPQIPIGLETNSTAPILSGQMVIEQ